ncbi:MAG: histidinol dehydrogenase [Solirubrobacterales bacterium]|jgi:histidinol dehydrogenase|nr:histidinol dehydrogenase [Solirubrobacterales bacterium]
MRLSRHEWDGRDPAALAQRLRSAVSAPAELSGEVAETIARVRAGGDAALIELSERFDGVRPSSLRVDPALSAGALAGLEPELRESLELAAANIGAVAEAQLEDGSAEIDVNLAQGQRVKQRRLAVGAAGIYAPGGRAAYPSSVLMCAIPARAAGVTRLALASPPGEDGLPQPLILAAAALCGIDEVYAAGGAQAIAALALGTETIAAVDVVAGPGNRYVAEAKRQLAGTVGIDSLAGPSELMAILGDDADLDWAALDICAQAEHGGESPLIACAVEAELLERLEQAVTRIAAQRPSVAEAELALVQAPDTDAAIELANAFAPEHLQLMCADAELLAKRVRSAGCVFCGNEAATAFGDYVAGSNHVLPTAGAGRFSGPLGPATFQRRMALVSLPAAAARSLAPHVERLARAEGFPVHGESASARSGAREDESGS